MKIRLEDITPVILAGGIGTRLKSVIGNHQKVLVHVNGVPFLSYLLKQLEFFGMKRVILCTGYKADEVKQEIGSFYNKLQISYSVENKPLGTGGAVKLALQQIDSNYILVMNGDSYIDYDLHEFIKWHSFYNFEVSLLLTKINDTSRYGRVTLLENGRIDSFVEKSTSGGCGYINTGVYLINTRLIEILQSDKEFSLEKDFFPKLVEARNISGFLVNEKFIDIGVPDSLRVANIFFNN